MPESPSGKPLHHMSQTEFERHIQQYLPIGDDFDGRPAEAARRMLGAEHDAAWDAYQEGRFPGTQEVVQVRRELLGEIREFARPGTPVGALFEKLEPSLASEIDPVRRLLAYERVCENWFNFRRGRQRQEVAEVLNADRETVGAELWDAIFDAAEHMGMTQNSELQDGEQLKCLAILGGTPNAIANRTKYSLEQLGTHGAITGSFDFLCSQGELESVLKEAAGLGAVHETGREVYADGVVIRFAPVDIHGRETPVRVLVGNDIWDEKQEKMVRARTLETTKLWADASNIQPGDNVKGVTTELYTGFQNANAREVVTYANGARIQVIGHSAAWAGGKRTANQLAQEIKAKVDSEYRLYLKLVEAGIAPPVPERDPVYVEALYEPLPDMRQLREDKAGYTEESINAAHPLYNEPLVNIAEYSLAGQAYYSRPNPLTIDGVPGVPPELWLRRSIAEELQRINQSLADPAVTAFFGGEVELYVEDAVRQIAMQQRLHDELVPALIRRQQPDVDDETVARKVKDIIAVPSNNPAGPSPHLTGGAFDVVLRYKQADTGFVPGANITMGHLDGETSERLYPDHFVDHPPATAEERLALRNRQAFYAIMTGRAFGRNTGFVPNPTEWFHWSRGDQLWARVQRLGGRVVQPFYSIPK